MTVGIQPEEFLFLRSSLYEKLVFNKIDTVDKLAEHTVEDILGLPRFGPTSLLRVQRWLSTYHNRALKAPPKVVSPVVVSEAHKAHTCGRCFQTYHVFNGLSVRAHNVLHQAGIFTVEDLVDWSAKDISGFRGMGRRTVNEIEVWLRGEFGLELSDRGSMVQSSWAARFAQQRRKYKEDVDRLEARVAELGQRSWKWQREFMVERERCQSGVIPDTSTHSTRTGTGTMIEDGSTPYTWST